MKDIWLADVCTADPCTFTVYPQLQSLDRGDRTLQKLLRLRLDPQRLRQFSTNPLEWDSVKILEEI